MQCRAIAVIGAGPSGLVTAKEAIQEGHRVTCFEKTGNLGGVFHFSPDPEKVGVWESCRLSSSILVTSFSDYFPGWETSTPYEHRHMLHHEYLDYLRRYAEHFQVLPTLKSNCEVLGISPGTNTAWRVTVRDRRHSREETHEFDSVAICSGVHRVPHIPSLPGLASFQGQILHSAHYKNPSSICGRSAVFIGAGESGGEIVAEASETLDRAYLSLRRGVFVIPRFLNGFPNDYEGTRLLYSLPDFVSRRTDVEAQEFKRRLALAFLPAALLRAGLVWALRYRATRRKRERRRLDPRWDRVETLIDQLRANSGGNQFETFATKTEAFIEAIVDGRCELRPAIRRVTPSGVVFADGREAQVDSIVFCTGYEPPSVPFLNVPVDLDHLYKNCFSPAYGEKLAFIGFVRPPLGSIPPMAELQARWFAQLQSGRLQLPAAEEMEHQSETERARRARYHHQVFGRLPYLVDFSTYMDDLAEIIGCKPQLLNLALTPRLLYKLYAGAFCAAQYRLRGPHAVRAMATRIILHSPSHPLVIRFVDLALAELARVLGLSRLQPHLSLTARRPERK